MRVAPERTYEASQDLAEADVPDLVQRAWRSFRRNLWVIAASALAFAALGAFYGTSRAPTYSARASIVIDPRIGEALGDAPQSTGVLLADGLVVDSEIAVLSSRDLFAKVAERLELFDAMRALMVSELEPGTPPPSDVEIRRATLDFLSDNVEIGREGTSYVLRIMAWAPTPELAPAIANSIADVYFEAHADEQIARLERSQGYLQARITDLSQQVMAGEQRVEDYKFQNDVQDDSQSRQGPLYAELLDNEATLIATRRDIRTATTEMATLDQALARINDASVGSRNAVISAQAELVTALGGEPNIVNSQVLGELQRMRDTREAGITVLEAKQTSLEATNTELKSTIARIASEQVELRELIRNADALRSQYETLLAFYEQTQTETGFRRSSARVIERATVPDKPSNASSTLLAVVGAIGGLLCGLGIVFIREQADGTVRSSEELVRRLGLLYLGPLPRVSSRDALASVPATLPSSVSLSRAFRRSIGVLSFVATHPLTLPAETLRRTVIEIRARRRDTEGPIRVAIVSAFPGEGKTTFSANLAHMLARQGARAVLVDGDLRSRSLVERLAPISSPILQSTDMAGSLDVWSVKDRLWLVGFTGAVDPEAIDGGEFRSMEDQLERAGIVPDYIVFDTPPLAYIPDSLFLARRLDSAVLMVRWGRTKVSDLQRVMARTQVLSDKIIGASLTGMTRRQLGRSEPVSLKEYYRRYDGPRTSESTRGAS